MTAVSNVPKEQDTWQAIARLANVILDPLVDHFGPLELTYGFASPELARRIDACIAPSLDHHAGSERSSAGRLVCSRRGMACDLRIPGLSATMVARYIAAKLPFDRLYLYGDERPLHVSVGPDESRQVTVMRMGPSGRLIPRTFAPEHWPDDA